MRESSDTDLAGLFQKLVGTPSAETASKITMFLYESGLTFPQIIVMDALSWNGAQSISTLAGQVRLSVAATSQLVDRLGEFEYLAREPDPTDGRVRSVRIRPRGAHFMARLNELRRQELKTAFDRLPGSVRALLAAALREAVDLLDAG